MRKDTGFACILILATMGLIYGCSKSSGGGNGPTTQPPSVTITSGPTANIFNNQSADFTWQGEDNDGQVIGYYAGLDDMLEWTTETSTSYSGFVSGSSHTFKIYALDNDSLESDIEEWSFFVDNRPPSIEITENPSALVFEYENLFFSLSGIDPDGNLKGFHVGINGNFTFTTDPYVSYSGFPFESLNLFQAVAEDSIGALSDTSEWEFFVEYSLQVEGQGVIDEDGDGFWTTFNIIWNPIVSSISNYGMRLLVGGRQTYGTGSEWLDSTDVVIRNPGDTDDLIYELPIFTKNFYDFRIEIHDADGLKLLDIPYDSITSLTQIGLEQFDGFTAWFDNAWTDNGIDANGDDYYESIELWWDVDASLDAVNVKVIVFERNSSNIERYLTESFVYEVEGLGDEDASGILITAGTTFGEYDYRLELKDEFNNLLDETFYGEYPDLTDIPLGVTVSNHPYNTTQTLTK